MSDRTILIISMFLLTACHRTGDAERKALEATAARARLGYDAKVYQEDLQECRSKYRDAGADADVQDKLAAFDRYELCARNADAKYYKKDGGVQ